LLLHRHKIKLFRSSCYRGAISRMALAPSSEGTLALPS
jgi:hypothetical protein